ncbi:MAG TPA: glycosyltransferase [Verrucomicrobiae bacterium]
MKELKQWWSEINGGKGSWLVLGKGLSLDRRNEFDLGAFRKLSLNHVVREMPVEVASVIDIDVVGDCAEAIDRNARFLLMPRYPHVKHEAAKRPLETFFDEFPILKKLDRENRLVWYNFASSEQQETGSPKIPNGYFSAEVMISLLAAAGAKSIRTLGVDGGSAYAPQFKDLDDKTRLANGHNTFDLQFDGMISTVRRHGIDFAPLTSETPVRIFIGTDESQLLGAHVLEFSVLKHCALPVVFDHMLHVKTPMPKDPKNQPRTGFSFSRFAIPKLAGYRGRAVYLDADMLVLRNFQDLWDRPFNGATVLHCATSDPKRPKQFAVLLLDCSRLKWDLNEIVRGLDEGRYNYDQLMKEVCLEPADTVRAALPPEWNSLEEYAPGKTNLIHYTDMHTQPWVSRKNRNGALWAGHLREALDSGYVTWKEVQDAVEIGFIRPSLLWELNASRRKFASILGPVIDARFKPHKKLAARLGKDFKKKK